MGYVAFMSTGIPRRSWVAMMGIALVLGLGLGLGSCCREGFASETGFQAGADLSHVGFFEDRGTVYRNGGIAEDPFQILAGHGMTWARLRLFTSSQAQATNAPYNSINTLDYTLRLARRAKAAGLRLLLDFHYSDSWADPGKQTKPAAWAGLAFDALEQKVYEYDRDTIAAFKAAGLTPDAVQVGNEIISGMLWPDGKVGGSYDTPAQWAKLGRLLKAAVRGIEESAGDQRPRIMIHIDRGGSWSGTQWFFDHLLAQQVPFDLIGQSYYPWWHGSLNDLRNCVTNTASRYGKPVVVVETAFPWVTTNWDGTVAAPQAGIAPGPFGQVRFVEELHSILANAPNGFGLGIFWWGTEYQSLTGYGLGGFDQRSFFDADGELLPVAAALATSAKPVLSKPQTLSGNVLRFKVDGPASQILELQSTGDFGAWTTVAGGTNHTGTITFDLQRREEVATFYRLLER